MSHEDNYVGLLHKKIETLENEKKKNQSKNKLLALFVFILFFIQCVSINFTHKKDTNNIKVEAKMMVSLQKQNKTIDNKEEINKFNINKNADDKNTIKQNEQVQLDKNEIKLNQQVNKHTNNKENKIEETKQDNNLKENYDIAYAKDDITDQIKFKLIASKENTSIVINNPTEEMKIIALRKDGLVIQYIENPSEQVKLAAVKQYGGAIRFIENPTDEIKMEAIKQDGFVIKDIENPTEEMQLEAIKQNRKYVKHIENPSQKVKEVIKMKSFDNIEDLIENMLKERRKAKHKLSN